MSYWLEFLSTTTPLSFPSYFISQFGNLELKCFSPIKPIFWITHFVYNSFLSFQKKFYWNYDSCETFHLECGLEVKSIHRVSETFWKKARKRVDSKNKIYPFWRLFQIGLNICNATQCQLGISSTNEKETIPQSLCFIQSLPIWGTNSLAKSKKKARICISREFNHWWEAPFALEILWTLFAFLLKRPLSLHCRCE